MKKLLIPFLLIASMPGVYAQGFKISAYPNKAVPAESDLFLLATPNVANWNITAAQLRQFMTNNVTVTLPPGLLTNGDTRAITFNNDVTINGNLIVNSTNAETIVSNLTVYGWQTNYGVISSTGHVGVFYGDGAGLTNVPGGGGITNANTTQFDVSPTFQIKNGATVTNTIMRGIVSLGGTNAPLVSTNTPIRLYSTIGTDEPGGPHYEAVIDFHRVGLTNNTGLRFFTDSDTNIVNANGERAYIQFGPDVSNPTNPFITLYDSSTGGDYFRMGTASNTHGHFGIGSGNTIPQATFSFGDLDNTYPLESANIQQSLLFSSITNGIRWTSAAAAADFAMINHQGLSNKRWINFEQAGESWRFGLIGNLHGSDSYDLGLYSGFAGAQSPDSPGSEVLWFSRTANNIQIRTPWSLDVTNGLTVGTNGAFRVSNTGVITGNGSGITNLPVAGIAATGIGATKYLKGDGTWDIPAMGAATNVIWPVAGTNIVAVTNGLEVQINAPMDAETLVGLLKLPVTITAFGGTVSSNSQNNTALNNVGDQYLFLKDITNYASITAGSATYYGPVLSASSTTNNPSNTELATAGWVRGLFNNGVLFYSTTNLYVGATNSDYPNIYSFSAAIPNSGARGYTNAALTAGNYIGTVITTNRFSQVAGPIDVDSYIGLTSAGSPNVTIHPEIYYSYDLTNWYGDFSAGNETITQGTTNLYQWVVSFPALISTNSDGFYLARRYKVGTASGLVASTVLWFTQGTNSVSGTAAASHIAIDGPNSALGNAFLANNQNWTGSNYFGGPTTFGGLLYGANGSTAGQVLTATATGVAWSNSAAISGGLTNGSTNVTLNGLTVNDYLIINATNATTTVSNLLVTGWQTNLGVISSTNFVGKFAGDATGLTNITAAQTPWASDINGNQKQLTNVAMIQVSGGGTNWFDSSYFTNGIYGNGAGLTNVTSTSSVNATNLYGPNLTTPTNTPTDAYVLTATGTGGATAWKAASANSTWVKEVFVGSTLAVSMPASAQRYVPIVGANSFSPQTAVTAASSPAPSGGYLSNLVVYAGSTWSAGTNVIFAVYTNTPGGTTAATPLTCTLYPALSGVITNSATTSVAIPDGIGSSMWSMGFFANSSITSATASWSVEWWHQLP